jgi:hypothetical protein
MICLGHLLMQFISTTGHLCHVNAQIVYCKLRLVNLHVRSGQDVILHVWLGQDDTLQLRSGQDVILHVRTGQDVICACEVLPCAEAPLSLLSL